MSVSFPARFELAFFRHFFGRRRLGGGRARGGGRCRQPVPVAARVAPITGAQRPGRLSRGRRGRRGSGGRGRRGRRRRSGGRGGRGGRRGGQTNRGRERRVAVLERRGMRAASGDDRVARLFAAGLLQNGVQVYRPFVRRP